MKSFLLTCIVILIVTTITTPRFLNIHDNIKFTNTAFAQDAGNASTIVVPSETGRMEITLKNAASNEPDYTIYIQVLTAVASAAAAIIGGYLASRYAHKQAIAIESLRNQQEKQKQEALEAKQEKLKKEYVDKLRQVSYRELQGLSSGIGSTMEKGFFEGLSDIYIKNVITTYLNNINLDFMKIPFDIRLTVFPVDVLFKVQGAYATWDMFAFGYKQVLKDYENHDIINLKEAVKNLDASALKNSVDEALKIMKEFLHQDDAKLK